MSRRTEQQSLFTLTVLALLASIGFSFSGGGNAVTMSRFTMSSSGFACGGRMFANPRQTPACYRSSRRGYMEMKKGKSRVPPQMRGNYEQMRQMQEMRQQAMEATKAGADGLPVFNLFVRSKKAGQWYPCGSFKGDEKSAGLAKNYANGGLLEGISKNQLDKGVGGSLHRDLAKLEQNLFRSYPQLRKSGGGGGLEWGYKLAFEGLSDEKAQMTVVTPEPSKGLFDNVKGMFGGN